MRVGDENGERISELPLLYMTANGSRFFSGVFLAINKFFDFQLFYDEHLHDVDFMMLQNKRVYECVRRVKRRGLKSKDDDDRFKVISLKLIFGFISKVSASLRYMVVN